MASFLIVKTDNSDIIWNPNVPGLQFRQQSMDKAIIISHQCIKICFLFI